MNQRDQYHLVGVAGVGMSALAQAMIGAGIDVTGSDRFLDKGENMGVLGKLKTAGVRLLPQDGTGVVSRTAAVVVSTAIEESNPDVAAARRCGVPLVHRAEMLGRLVSKGRCIAVTGTSGKSTVTGMLGWIFEQLGKDPNVVNGAPVMNWCSNSRIGNARAGKSDLWIIEADESDRSLMQFHPDWSIITNASQDHFELGEVLNLFEKFAGQVRCGIVNAVREPGILAGFEPETAVWGSRFRHGGVDFRVNLPGRHNAANALLAVVLCERMGMGLGEVAEALATFKGIERRLEQVGAARGVRVLDDYGHNPAKIKAAFDALQPYCKRMMVVWRPHGYKPLALMMDELTEMFSSTMRPVDTLIVLPVYDAGGTADRSVNSDTLVSGLRAKGVNAEFAVDTAVLPDEISATAVEGDVVVTMGARDPGLPLLAREIVEKLTPAASEPR